MRVVVVIPPDPYVLPSDVPGSHAADDATVSAWIAAAQAEIDGPTGMLGKAIGAQTLELQIDAFPCAGWGLDAAIKLPCPPIIEVESISYTDPDGVVATLTDADWSLQLGTNKLFPAVDGAWPTAIDRAGSVRVRYRAGYDGEALDEGGTGEIPQQVKQAIILLVGLYKSTGAENLFLSSVTVDGVGSRQYVVSEAAGKAIRGAVDGLLRGLKETPL